MADDDRVIRRPNVEEEHIVPTGVEQTSTFDKRQHERPIAERILPEADFVRRGRIVKAEEGNASPSGGHEESPLTRKLADAAVPPSAVLRLLQVATCQPYGGNRLAR